MSRPAQHTTSPTPTTSAYTAVSDTVVWFLSPPSDEREVGPVRPRAANASAYAPSERVNVGFGTGSRDDDTGEGERTATGGGRCADKFCCDCDMRCVAPGELCRGPRGDDAGCACAAEREGCGRGEDCGCPAVKGDVARGEARGRGGRRLAAFDWGVCIGCAGARPIGCDGREGGSPACSGGIGVGWVAGGGGDVARENECG